jgi:uncharacterized protein YecE (DUF72 family)
MGCIRVGIAGWDYRDWNGPVYPVPAPAGLDRLAWVCRYVDVIEINSTFYRPVNRRVGQSWVRRTAFRGDRFRFTAKAHRSWTHDRSIPEPETVRQTLDGLTPLLDAGRLSALLVQFPYSFRFDEEARGRLETIVRYTRDWPVVIEVRHSSWQSGRAESWFDSTGLGWCVVDQPLVGRRSAKPLPRVNGPLGYLRLHGRNTRNWFRQDAGRDERYDYLYGRRELDELARCAVEMNRTAEQLVIVQNNHFRGQALANALELKHLLGGDKPAAPESLVRAFPSLAESVSVERTRLF